MYHCKTSSGKLIEHLAVAGLHTPASLSRFPFMHGVLYSTPLSLPPRLAHAGLSQSLELLDLRTARKRIAKALEQTSAFSAVQPGTPLPGW